MRKPATCRETLADVHDLPNLKRTRNQYRRLVEGQVALPAGFLAETTKPLTFPPILHRVKPHSGAAPRPTCVLSFSKLIFEFR